MAPRTRDHRRDERRRGRRAGAGAARGVAMVLLEPGVITAEELAAAAEFAARDAAGFDADWAARPSTEHDAVAAREEELDADEDAAAAGARWWEAEWLALAAAGAAGATAAELLAVATAAPGSLGAPEQPGRPGSSLEQLRCLDRLTAMLAGHRHGLIAALCPGDDDTPSSFRAEQHLVEELQVATRVGPGVAARSIDTARLLAGPFAASRYDLLAGQISDAHVRVLAWETCHITDDPVPGTEGSAAPGWRSREDKLTAIQARVAGYARIQTPSQFASTVRAVICAVDPAGEADRHASAKSTRDVSRSRDSDGIGVLVDRDDAATVEAIHAALTDAAKALQTQRGGTAAARAGDPDARLGACRADVLKTLVLGPRALEGGSWEPRQRDLEGHLVIDLATLRREADNPCLLDGQPIPAPVGRALVASVKAWRRMVTDPVTGHLLDYGHRVYLPEPLVAFTKARDGRCAAPYCERPARRCQMDHRDPFPHGPSSSGNCGSFCEDRHHPLKTDGWIEVTASDASGAITYRTLWGQTVTTTPNAYLPNHRAPTPETGAGDGTGPPGGTGPPDDADDPEPPSP